MSTKPILFRMIWLLTILSTLVACTSNVQTQSPAPEPTTGVVATPTPVVASYHGVALPTPKPVVGFAALPPVWLIVGSQAIPSSLAAGGNQQGHFDPSPAIPNIATATLPADTSAIIVVASESFTEFKPTVRAWSEDGSIVPLFDNAARELKVEVQKEENLTVFTLEPTGDAGDQLLNIHITFPVENAWGVYVWRLNPIPESLAPTPEYDQTATAIVQAVVSTVQPKVHSSMLSPDMNWRVEIVIYDCVQVTEDGPNAYEQLKLIRVGDGTESVIATQLQSCGGVGAYGLGELYWSSDSRYFYYTDAREGSPDGLCWYWERPIYRLDVLTQETELLGSGPFSPDQTKIAMWQENDLVIWSLYGGELSRIPAVISDAKRGPIAWSPDSESLVYLQNESDCFPFGKSYVIRFDMSKTEQNLLLESDTPSFIYATWDASDRITLSDEQGNHWVYDLATLKLEQVP